jgi:hypothetical protein
MSSLIQPSQGSPNVPRATPLAPSIAARASAPQTSPTSESEAPVSLDTLPSAPPPEVLAQIQTAGANYENLRAQGYEVHYSHDEQTRKTTVQLRDGDGTVLKTLTPSEAVDLTMGGADGLAGAR